MLAKRIVFCAILLKYFENFKLIDNVLNYSSSKSANKRVSYRKQNNIYRNGQTG